MPNDKATAPKVETGSNGNIAKEAGDNMYQQVHNLRYQCPDGTLVTHPRECGKDKERIPMKDEMAKLFPKLEIG